MKKIHFRGRIISVSDNKIKLSNGRQVFREVVHHPGAVAIIGINEKKEIMLIKQYRHAVGGDIWEIPAGLVNKGETKLKAAQREFEEETGYYPKKVKKALAAYTTPGYSDELLHYFFAQDLEKTCQNMDEDEEISAYFVPLKKAKQMIKTGEINDNKTIIGVLMAYDAFLS